MQPALNTAKAQRQLPGGPPKDVAFQAEIPPLLNKYVREVAKAKGWTIREAMIDALQRLLMKHAPDKLKDFQDKEIKRVGLKIED